MWCVLLLLCVCAVSKRVCVFVCGLLRDVVWYVVCAAVCVLFFLVFVWFVCDRVCDGVWRVVVDWLYACGLKLNKCLCALCGI